MKTVLVTGGFGYVGSRLTPLLLDMGYQVRVLDRFLYGEHGLDALQADPRFAEWQERFSLVRGDLRDPVAVREALAGMDAVIHLAAISNDPTGEVDEVLTRQVNFDAVGQLLVLAKAAGVSRFINASSSSVFGIKADTEVTEELEPEPLTFYSKYKALSEWLVRAANGPGFCAVNIRPATICGFSPRQRFDLTVNKLTADAVRTGIITVHGGEQRRPNVGMTDVIALYAFLLEADSAALAGRTFNFGFENHRILDIARLIQDELSELGVRIDVAPVFDQRDYHISSARLLAELGFQPRSSIRQEVRALRTVLDSAFPDIEADRFYNMKVMRLERDARPFRMI